MLYDAPGMSAGDAPGMRATPLTVLLTSGFGLFANAEFQELSVRIDSPVPVELQDVT